MPRHLVVFLLAICSLVSLSAAQEPTTGLPPLGSFAGGPFDTINLANLNAHFAIPIFSRPGKGVPFTYSLTYDSLVWQPVTSGQTTSWQPMSNWGWNTPSSGATGWVEDTESDTDCSIIYLGFIYHDSAGGSHPFPGSVIYWLNLAGCGTHQNHYLSNVSASDNSGYLLTTNGLTATVNARGGLTIVVPRPPASLGSGSVTDANGNVITTTYNSNNNPPTTSFKDTLNSTALTITGNPPTYPNCTSVNYQYTAPGGTATYTVSYASYSVQTNFLVSGIQEYGGTSGQGVCLVNRVTLPDNTYYRFSYESTGGLSGKTTGRIASVTLPTGGSISYSYSGTGCGNNNNCMMADGSPSSMTRMLSAGTSIIDQPGTWTYTRAFRSASAPYLLTSTTAIDAAGNETDFKFSSGYLTQQTGYSGNGSSKSQLQDTFVCYNGNYSNCQTATVTPPITYRAHYEDFPNYFLTEYSYDQYGNLTSQLDHDLTSGAPVVRKTIVSYNSALCTPTPPAKNICDHPSSVEVQDGSGIRHAYASYIYDNGSNTNGNLTNVSKWVSSSSSNLAWQYTYNTQSGGGGTLATATDPKGTITTYSYGGTSCNAAFPTSVTVGPMPAIQYQYNCTGGVVVAVTDPNNATTTINYSDPYFWRPAQTKDPLSNINYFNYYDVNNSGSSAVTEVGQTESVMTFNGGSSTADSLTTVDAFGRVDLVQTRQSPGSSTWDSTEYLYNPNGNTSYVTLPFAGAAAQPVGSIPSTGYFYDALNRYSEIATFDGHNQLSHTDFTYNQNDVKVSVNPASQGSSYPTSKQYEYDALGRLTSVCELLPSGGGSACSQSSPPGNGYMTTYSYDPLNNLMGVSQSGQTRSYTYDGLSRMLSENNAESGTTTYTYDTVGGGYCAVSGAYTSQGDLVAKADANGNHVCYFYDGLHRVTDVGNNRQSAANACMRFRYDNSLGIHGAYPSGMNPTPQYYWGRLVEAATDNCGAQNDQTLTDEWFSYSARGEQKEFWESTPNSGGWYHTSSTYASNGPVSTRVAYLGTGVTTPFSNSFAYSLDGEGRPIGLQDTTIAKALWSGTQYSTAGQPNIIRFYNGDEEQFAWDPNSLRMLWWDSTVGIKYQTGVLTWNANGTLQNLSITDNTGTNSATQSCNYTYDDLARAASGTCSDGWGQDFSYDAFGNINKTIPPAYTGTAFNPGPYLAGNRVPGFSYDSNGNVLNDGVNTYVYSTYNRPVSAGGVNATYDAFSRLVEAGNRQLVYAPDGYKFAFMSGQTVQKYIVPLTAGVHAVYTAATPAAPAYWVHSDWLGSGRLASTPNQTVQWDTAYAPFGENYTLLGASTYTFTGQTQDMVSGIYDFLSRQYSPTQGRWMVPDPAGLAAVDITNPQTWNRYAYVGNNPLNATDPLGLYLCTTDDDGNVICDEDDTGGGGDGGVGAPGQPDPGVPVCGPGQCGDTGTTFTATGTAPYPTDNNLSTPDQYNGNVGSTSPLVLGQNGSFPNDPSSIFRKFSTRGYPNNTPQKSPGPIRPGEPNVTPPRDPVPPPPSWLKALADYLDALMGGTGGLDVIFWVNPCNTAGGAALQTCYVLAPPQKL